MKSISFILHGLTPGITLQSRKYEYGITKHLNTLRIHRIGGCTITISANTQKSQQESDIFDGVMTDIFGTAVSVLYTLRLSLAYRISESNNYCTVLFLALTDTHQPPSLVLHQRLASDSTPGYHVVLLLTTLSIIY